MTTHPYSTPHRARPVRAEAIEAIEAIELHTRDGLALAASRFRPIGAPRALLVIAPAIAVAQRFYRRAAIAAQTEGFDTITFDYRNMGRNAPASLRGASGDLFTWAEQDLAAAVDHAADHADAHGLPTFLLAHSFGGQALGLLPNHHRLHACYAFGTGAGWSGWMPLAERWRVRMLWHVLGPLLTASHGYLGWKALGMGEDLPLSVYRQWKSWCRHPYYCFDEPAVGTMLRERFARVRMPIAAATAVDDRWSPPRSCDAFMRAYTGSAVERIDLHPQMLGAPIGHMGYFRPHANPLWRTAMTWLLAHSG
ncbi:MAG: alpha/beta fold hydrolase [Gemmatimonadaceae bacterium]|nr:alpha/beta fold hydrolase [Gemmatimonadaceae bacterium]